MTGAARAWAPVYAARHGHPLRRDLRAFGDYYDVLEPVDLIVLGRVITLLLSLAVVALLGRMAARLTGPGTPVGWIAALAAALLPALVIRSGIVTVDVYAALAVVAALDLADRARLAPRPDRQLLLALLSGVASGLAFVSKYPAGLVSLGVALSLCLADRTWPRRLLSLFVAGAGAVAAALLGMPALVLRTKDVVAAVRFESGVYATMPEGSYWDQVLHRAEWDQPLRYPELGWPCFLLALAGLAVALADRRWRKSVLPWLLYGAATVALFSRFPFRAFRNLLPLAALSPVLVALFFTWLLERLDRPRWITLGKIGAGLLLVLLFAAPLCQYVEDRLRLVDSRVQAVDWLAAHGGRGDPVLIVEQIAFQPAELARLPQPVTVRPWPQAREALEPGSGVRYLVAAELTEPALSPRDRQEILAAFALKARFGGDPTPKSPGWFRGNREIVYVLERRGD